MEHDPVRLFERAARGAAGMAARVTDEQRTARTPCIDWDVEALLEHMVGGAAYLLAAMGVEPSPGEPYASAVNRCVEELRRPGALELRCMSPAGFEWTVGEAAAGTFMDQLVHTWDLGIATGQDATLDPELAEICVAMFLPQMPEIGRQAGIVGPAVGVPADASAQDRLLGAMGRHP